MRPQQKQVFAQIQHFCENLLKEYSHETKKLENNFIPNPKNTQLLFTNWQVDIEGKMQALKKQDENFYNLLKGKVHSFETAAQHFVQHYIKGAQQTDSDTSQERMKKIQTDIEEMRRLLDDLFKS